MTATLKFLKQKLLKITSQFLYHEFTSFQTTLEFVFFCLIYGTIEDENLLCLLKFV